VVVSGSGVIEGDLITAGANVVLDGQVQGNVRAAGASIQLNGAVGRNVLGAAHDIQLGSSGRVGGNMIGAAENLTLAGDVAGSLSGAGNFDLQGNIGRGAELALESLTVGPQARIGGSLTYYADHEQSAIPAGVAAGGVRFVQTENEHQRETVRRPDQRFGALGNVLGLTWLTGTAIVGLVLLRLFPRFAAEFLAVLETQPLPSLGLGVLTLIGTVPVAIVFALTIIGIPVALLMVIVAYLWQDIGYNLVIFIAALQAIPKSVTDAARVDGATSWQIFRHITLPLLKPTILLASILTMISAFQVFELFQVMTRGGPEDQTLSLSVNIYRNAFRYQQMGWAAAMSVVLFFIVFVISLVQTRMLRQRWEY
jgi:ABC-type sugar transport system permease subunit/cytoskeletal protein CcmA (bactofilin family)